MLVGTLFAQVRPMIHVTGDFMHRRNWANASIVLLVLSVALNVVLSKQLIALRTPPPTKLLPGERVSALQVKTLSGDAVTIGFDGTLPTVFYYFSPTCSWCERNWENVRALVDTAPGRYRFVGLSSTPKGVEEKLKQHGLSFEVYTGLSADAARAYRLTGTPHTVLVSPQGTVVRAWAGAYVAKQAPEIERYLALKLPGLSAAAR